MRFISASPSQSPTLKKIVMAFVQGCVKCTSKELPAGAKVPLRPTLLVPLHLPDMVQDLLNTLAVSP